MSKAVSCSRCSAVTHDETVEDLVAKVQHHNRKEHRTFLSREQVLLLARLHSWAQRSRSFAFDSGPADSWLGVVRVR